MSRAKGVALGAAIAAAVVASTWALKRACEPRPVSTPPQTAANDGIAPGIDGYAAALRDGRNAYYGTQQTRELEARLREFRGGAPERASLLRELAYDLLRFNETDRAIGHLREVVELAKQSGQPAVESRARYDLAVALVRQAMLENCLPKCHGEACVLPFAPRAQYTVDEAVREARRELEVALRLTPHDLRCRWLLTIAAGAVGEDPGPDGIPLKAGATLGRFRNVAITAGITATNLAGGTAVEDFDGDGLLDVATSECNPSGRLHLWRRLPSGGFEDRAEAAGLAGQLGGLNLVHTDFDNDGRPDLFVLRGGWLESDGRMRNSLLRNNGDGTFLDVTERAGLAYPARPTQTCAWADFDGDGDLDVYVGCESQSMQFPSQLFRNNGDGTFTDVARDAGVENWRYAKGVAAGDYDGDGRMDLYVSNFGDTNRLYRNLGGLRFEDVAAGAGVEGPRASFPTWWFDYDQDGRLDLFVAGYARDIVHVAADRAGLPHDGPTLRLYRNRGDGAFDDVTEAVGLAHSHLVMGCSFGDFDNDGWPDLFLGTGFPSFDSYEPNVAYRNVEGRRFEEVTVAGGFGHLPKGHGVAFADFDHDGDQDLFVELGGFYPGDYFFNALFVNPGAGNRWIVLRLEGGKSNRAAVGARVAVRTAAGRTLHAAVTSGSSFGGNPRRLEVGLGREAGPVEVEIRWPSGETQTERLEPQGFYRVLEGSGALREEPPRVALPE